MISEILKWFIIALLFIVFGALSVAPLILSSDLDDEEEARKAWREAEAMREFNSVPDGDRA